MIHFVCICGEPFDVPAELAGESMQCPACRRLVDVPLLGQAGSFDDDGTVRLVEEDETPSDFEEKMRVFGHGEDLRQNYDAFMTAGSAPADPADAPARRPTPRYDPITGELMLPMGIQGDGEIRPQPAIDTASPVLGYAGTTPHAMTVATASDIGWWSVPWRVVSGMSLIAVTVVFALHAVIVLGLALPGFNVFFVLPALVILVAIVAHYANTMEDIGPNLKDRVPVLLRSVSISEDVTGPLFLLLAAAVFSFGPLAVLAVFSPHGTFVDYPWVPLTALGWGFLVFPLAAFTAVCGGVLANLTPKRLTSVVIAAPIRYATAAAAFWAASVAYVVAFASTGFPTLQALQQSTPITHGQVVQFAVEKGLTLGVFALAIYLMHLAAFWFGLLHRAKHVEFDWVMQRHERTYRTDTVAQLMQRKSRPAPPGGGRDRPKAVGGGANAARPRAAAAADPGTAARGV